MTNTFTLKERKDKNNRLAAGFIPPQILIMLLFRLCITIYQNNTDKFEPNLSIKRIREIAKSEKDKDLREAIVCFYTDEAETLIRRVKEEIEEIPSYIQMQIATTKPDLMLLAFYLVTKFDFYNKNLKGLVLFLFWFCKDINITNNLIFRKTVGDETADAAFNHILDVIYELTTKDKLHIIYTPTEIRNALIKNNSLVAEYKDLPEFQFIWNSRVFDEKIFFALCTERIFKRKLQ